MANQKEQKIGKQNLTKNIIWDIVRVASFLIFGIIVLFVSAGRINWLWAWIYSVITILIPLIALNFIPPEVLAERGRKKENVEKWDVVITRLIYLPWFAQYIVSGLDFRFEWSPELALPLHITAVVLYISGEALQIWSMSANTYFSNAVRLQYDRGHTVCASGPYQYIRHPGYLGMMVYYLATPIILSSIWALIPAGAIVILLIIRTALEDQTLKNKLEGYGEYSRQVKYRLIPLIW